MIVYQRAGQKKQKKLTLVHHLNGAVTDALEPKNTGPETPGEL